MMKIQCAAVGAILFLAQPEAAIAAGLVFDCDVPANRYSSITAEITAPIEISGTISPLVMRSGDFLPVATVTIFPAPESPGVGFQLAAGSSRAKQLDIFFLNNRTPDRRTPLGQVAKSGNFSFHFTLSETGRGTLQIDERTFTFEADAVPAGTLMVSCSTGQFKFANLEWTSGDRAD